MKTMTFNVGPVQCTLGATASNNFSETMRRWNAAGGVLVLLGRPVALSAQLDHASPVAPPQPTSTIRNPEKTSARRSRWQ